MICLYMKTTNFAGLKNKSPRKIYLGKLSKYIKIFPHSVSLKCRVVIAWCARLIAKYRNIPPQPQKHFPPVKVTVGRPSF